MRLNNGEERYHHTWIQQLDCCNFNVCDQPNGLSLDLLGVGAHETKSLSGCAHSS